MNRLGLSVWWENVCYWCWLWARREINPMHPDLPRVIHNINRIEFNQRRRLT
jgi:hypothetical protein